MRKVRIVADSSANLMELNTVTFEAAPLKIITADREFVDDRKLDLEEMIRYFKSYKGKSQTSCPNPEDWLTAFADAEDIFCVTITGGLSGSHNAACIARDLYQEKYPNRRVFVIDSLSASRGQGLLVHYAAQEMKKGKSLDEVAAFVQEMIPHNCHWFTVADLNQLKRGGRISAATALVGTMMNIKPVLRVSDEGKLESVSKSRGIKAALTELVNQMEKTGTAPLADQTVLICHANCPENVEFVSKLLRERFGVTDIRAEFIGPVIGSHTGMGTLGLFFRGEHR